MKIATKKLMQWNCINSSNESEDSKNRKVRTSWTATLIAFCQFLGSAVTVRVVTVHPSLPESLWSNSTEVNGGFELWKIWKIKKKTFGGLIKLGDVDLYKQNSAWYRQFANFHLFYQQSAELLYVWVQIIIDKFADFHAAHWGESIAKFMINNQKKL
jgi:hypothetical protein